MLLARTKSTRHPSVLEHLPDDGSYLAQLDDLPVRMIDAQAELGAVRAFPLAEQ